MENNTRENYIHDRWQQLNNLVISTVDTGVKYLFAVSGGGCIAVLAFIGGLDKDQANLTWLGVSLGLFFIALILVGLLNILRFAYINNILNLWRSNADKLRANKITFDLMMQEDEAKVKASDWLADLAFVSFGLIILAGVAGFVSFICP